VNHTHTHGGGLTWIRLHVVHLVEVLRYEKLLRKRTESQLSLLCSDTLTFIGSQKVTMGLFKTKITI
jgi:hypothetical protein